METAKKYMTTLYEEAEFKVQYCTCNAYDRDHLVIHNNVDMTIVEIPEKKVLPPPELYSAWTDLRIQADPIHPWRTWADKFLDRWKEL